MREFIDHHFDKMLLATMIILDRSAMLLTQQPDLAKWMERADELAFGALIAIMTGRAALPKKDSGNPVP